VILAVTDRVRREIVADYAVAPAAIRVVYNGVDGERFHPRHRASLGQRARAALGCGPGERLCVAIGSGFERKGFDLLLRLWRDDPPPDMRLALVGDDERLARYRREAAALAGRVVVTGPRDDVEAVLAGADVLCVPSRQEAFGNVVLEACAAGVPVVTSARVGAAELLGGMLATLVIEDPEDLPALRRAIETAVGARHDAFAAAARGLAEGRPWSRHVDEVETVLGDAARG
jgi:UDP-glucose:(heptosyl)LPS alpha-1,3-glucosyltransferase